MQIRLLAARSNYTTRGPNFKFRPRVITQIFLKKVIFSWNSNDRYYQPS